MSERTVMIKALRTLQGRVIKKDGIVQGMLQGGIDQSKTKVFGAVFRHFGRTCLEFAGLVYGRIKAGVSKHLTRFIKAVDIADLTEEHGSVNGAGVGNG